MWSWSGGEVSGLCCCCPTTRVCFKPGEGQPILTPAWLRPQLLPDQPVSPLSSIKDSMLRLPESAARGSSGAPNKAEKRFLIRTPDATVNRRRTGTDLRDLELRSSCTLRAALICVLQPQVTRSAPAAGACGCCVCVLVQALRSRTVVPQTGVLLDQQQQLLSLHSSMFW